MKFWKSAEELPGLVALSLAKTIKMFPAVGWIRANKVASEDLLTEVNDLHKKITELQAASAEFRPTIENLAGLEDRVKLYGTYFRSEAALICHSYLGRDLCIYLPLSGGYA